MACAFTTTNEGGYIPKRSLCDRLCFRMRQPVLRTYLKSEHQSHEQSRDVKLRFLDGGYRETGDERGDDDQNAEGVHSLKNPLVFAL